MLDQLCDNDYISIKNKFYEKNNPTDVHFMGIRLRLYTLPVGRILFLLFLFLMFILIYIYIYIYKLIILLLKVNSVIVHPLIQ